MSWVMVGVKRLGAIFSLSFGQSAPVNSVALGIGDVRQFVLKRTILLLAYSNEGCAFGPSP